MKGEIRLGDIGTVFEFVIKDQNDAVLDVSGATTKDMIFLKPDRLTKVTKATTFTTDGTDGKIRYVSESDFLDEVGDWQRQAKVVLAGGTWHTDIRAFRVHPNL